MLQLSNWKSGVSFQFHLISIPWWGVNYGAAGHLLLEATHTSKMDSDSEKRNSSLVRTGVKVEPEEAIDIDEDAWLAHSSKDVKDENEETVIKEEEEEEEEYGDEKHQISSAFFSWKRGLDSATAYRCTWCKDGETKVFSNLPDFKAHALLRHESQVSKYYCGCGCSFLLLLLLFPSFTSCC